MMRVAMIGCGARATYLITALLKKHPQVKLVAIADPDEAGVRHRLGEQQVDVGDVAFHADADAMLAAAERIDGVIIGTRCHLHTPVALKVAPLGVPLLLEKPVAITREQHDALAAAYAGREDAVVVCFPLRCAPIFRKAREIVQSGRLGTITQVQAINNVPYGGVYYGTWYRRYQDTGDLWLQKATHDIDYITHLLGSRPEQVVAMESRTAMGGDMPAGLHCAQCDRTETCLESPLNLERTGANNGVPHHDHPCLFGEEIRHHDAGSALIRYANGCHAAYTQNFVARREAGYRGATIIGYRATLTFDFSSQSLTVVEHHSDTVDRITVESGDDHFGGDTVLIDGFVRIMRGDGPSPTPLSAGLLSAATCLAAGEAARTGVAQNVAPPRPAAQPAGA